MAAPSPPCSHDDTPNLFPWTPRVARLGLIYAALQAVGLTLPAFR